MKKEPLIMIIILFLCIVGLIVVMSMIIDENNELREKNIYCEEKNEYSVGDKVYYLDYGEIEYSKIGSIKEVYELLSEYGWYKAKKSLNEIFKTKEELIESL